MTIDHLTLGRHRRGAYYCSLLSVGALVGALATGCQCSGSEPTLDEAAMTKLADTLEAQVDRLNMTLVERSSTTSALVQHRAFMAEARIGIKLPERVPTEAELTTRYADHVKMFGFQLIAVRIGTSASSPLEPSPEREGGYPFSVDDVIVAHPLSIELKGGDRERVTRLCQALTSKTLALPLVDLNLALVTPDGFTLSGTLYRGRQVRPTPRVRLPPSHAEISRQAKVSERLDWSVVPALTVLYEELITQHRALTEWHAELDEATRLGRLRQAFRVRTRTIEQRKAPRFLAKPSTTP